MSTLVLAKEVVAAALKLGMVFNEVAYDRFNYDDSRRDEMGRISVGITEVQLSVLSYDADRAAYLAEQFGGMELTGDADIGYSVVKFFKAAA
jgi:hypothetical protein